MTNPPLHAALDRAQAFAPEYGERLSNHLPMALTALSKLGADELQMEKFLVWGSVRLAPAPPDTAPCANWTALRGQPRAFAAVRAHFARDIATLGAQDTVRAALPWLADGVGGAAFHGLLRTAFALIAEHDSELASGLAHWTCTHMPLLPAQARGQPGTPSPDVDLRTWLSELSAATKDWRSSGGLIADRMHSFSRTVAFQTHAARLKVNEGTLRELADIALEHYLRSRNFTVLHLVTSAHALRVLSPHFDAPLSALRHYALAFAAGVAASGINPDAPELAVTPQPWTALKAIACEATDEHIVKIIYACEAEWQVAHDDRYRVAASLAARSHEA